jgi:hypothetical protein
MRFISPQAPDDCRPRLENTPGEISARAQPPPSATQPRTRSRTSPLFVRTDRRARPIHHPPAYFPEMRPAARRLRFSPRRAAPTPICALGQPLDLSIATRGPECLTFSNLYTRRDCSAFGYATFNRMDPDPIRFRGSANPAQATIGPCQNPPTYPAATSYEGPRRRRR